MIRLLPPSGHLLIALAGVFAQCGIYVWEAAIIRENGRLMDQVVDHMEGKSPSPAG